MHILKLSANVWQPFPEFNKYGWESLLASFPRVIREMEEVDMGDMQFVKFIFFFWVKENLIRALC